MTSDIETLLEKLVISEPAPDVETSTLVKQIESVLMPYTLNGNTGNSYEIFVILKFARDMGLTDDEFTTLEPLFVRIRLINNSVKTETAILMAKRYACIKGKPLLIDGQEIVEMRNITQSDEIGKTGDLLLITGTGKQISVSICGGQVKRGGKISKCLTNPSARRLKATEEDMERSKQRGLQAIEPYKEYMREVYGDNEEKWPSRVKTKASTDACCDVALWTAERFETLDVNEKIEIFKDLLRIDSISEIPADYLVCVNEKTFKHKIFKFNKPIFTVWDPSIIADGIYLTLVNDGVEIGRIQVKFNNGVYHRGKTSSINASWNFTAHLTDVFRLEAV